MGIGKRALMEDYYPDELGAVIGAWNALHGADESPAPMEPMDFLGEGGERL